MRFGLREVLSAGLGSPTLRQASLPLQTKKGRPDGRPYHLSQKLRLCSGYFGLNGGLFALDVGFAAFLMLVFIVLFSHNCLYFSRWLRFGVRHYEFLQPTIQSLFLAGSALGTCFGLRQQSFSS